QLPGPGGAMRRLMAALLLAVALAPAGCKRRNRGRAAAVEENIPAVSVLNVADPEAPRQLVRGFYSLEDDAWRWTRSRFSVALRPPEGSSRSGARLELKGSIPETVIQRLGPISLSATINGQALKPETFSKGGILTYSREAPASALIGVTATVE